MKPAFVTFTVVTFLASATLQALGATLITWDKEQEAAVQNYVAGKHLVVKINDQSQNVPVGEIQLMRLAPKAPSVLVPKNSPIIWLDGNGWFSFSKVVSAENQLQFDSPFLGTGKVDLTAIRVVAFQRGIMDGPLEPEIKKFLKQAPRNDILMLTGTAGRVVPLEGVFVKLDEKNLTFRWMENEQVVPMEKVVALVLAPIKKAEIDKSAFVSVLATDGSVLQGKLAELDATMVKIDVPGLGLAIVDIAKVNTVDFTTGRSVQVSSLEPADTKQLPYFDHVFPYRRDMSVGGKPLTLGGSRYEYGLGVHSRCALSYDIGKKYSRLIGFVGIDDEVGRIGDVVFKVIADGKEIYNSGNVKGGDAAKRISLNVANVDRLTIEVDFGEDMDIGDHADWADLKLVK